MPKHTPQARLNGLITYVGWQGDSVKFAELLPTLINRITDPKIQEAMKRYYGGGQESQLVNPVTGRPHPQDSRFYQHLEKGRVFIKSVMSFDPVEYDMLKEMRPFIC
jgi:hypothetical protein